MFNVFDLIIYPDDLIGYIISIGDNILYIKYGDPKVKEKVYYGASRGPARAATATCRPVWNRNELVFYKEELLKDIKENKCKYIPRKIG